MINVTLLDRPRHRSTQHPTVKQEHDRQTEQHQGLEMLRDGLGTIQSISTTRNMYIHSAENML